MNLYVGNYVFNMSFVLYFKQSEFMDGSVKFIVYLKDEERVEIDFDGIQNYLIK